MRIIWLVWLIAGALVACGNNPEVVREATAGLQPGALVQIYRCGDTEFKARFEADSVRIWLQGEERLLPSVVSASGARYQADDWLFWSKGDEAMLDAGALSLRGCRPVEHAAMAGPSG